LPFIVVAFLCCWRPTPAPLSLREAHEAPTAAAVKPR